MSNDRTRDPVRADLRGDWSLKIKEWKKEDQLSIA